MDIGYADDSSVVTLGDEDNLTRFMTCSSDRTIRFWHFMDPTTKSEIQQNINKGIAKNAYCRDMSRMIYVNSENRDISVS